MLICPWPVLLLKTKRKLKAWCLCAGSMSTRRETESNMCGGFGGAGWCELMPLFLPRWHKTHAGDSKHARATVRW